MLLACTGSSLPLTPVCLCELWEMSPSRQRAECITDTAPWNSLRDACGPQARRASATHPAQGKVTSCRVWLWGHSSFTWGMQVGGRRQEHRVCLPQSWLFVDTAGTDGSSVPTMALFLPSPTWYIVRFLFRFLLLKSGSVPNTSNVINKVWKCQSLLSFTGKIAKKTLWEHQAGSSPRQGRPGIAGGAFFVNGTWVKFILIKFQKCPTDSMLELTWREGSRRIPDVEGIAK